MRNRDGTTKGTLRLSQGSGDGGLHGIFTFNLRHEYRLRFLLDLFGPDTGQDLRALDDMEAKMASASESELLSLHRAVLRELETKIGSAPASAAALGNAGKDSES